MLTKDHFNKHYDEEIGWFWSKVKGEASKNHKKDFQKLKEGGIIPQGDCNEFGLDPGLYIEMYLSHLNPENNRFFQKPSYGKDFKIHKDETNVYYANSAVGHTLVGLFMPNVSN